MLADVSASGVFFHGLLWLAIAAGTELDDIRGATALYFVGATVGLFDRLYTSYGPPLTFSGLRTSSRRLYQVSYPDC